MEVDLREAQERPFTIITDLRRPKAERIAAAFALELIATDEAVEALARCLFADPSPIVRHEAAFSLGETANRKAVDHLLKAMFTDRDIFVRHEAAMALGTLGDERARPYLERLRNDPAAAMRESIEIALERLGGRD